MTKITYEIKFGDSKRDYVSKIFTNLNKAELFFLKLTTTYSEIIIHSSLTVGINAKLIETEDEFENLYREDLINCESVLDEKEKLIVLDLVNKIRPVLNNHPTTFISGALLTLLCEMQDHNNM